MLAQKLDVNTELKRFDKNIKGMAGKFLRAFQRLSIDGLSISLYGYTKEDIEQELRIRLWRVVEEINSGKVTIGDSYEPYIQASLNYHILSLKDKIRVEKRGYDAVHDYDCYSVTGTFKGNNNEY